MKFKKRVIPKTAHEAGVNWLISIALIFFSNTAGGTHANPFVNLTFGLVGILGVIGFLGYSISYVILKRRENKEEAKKNNKAS